MKDLEKRREIITTIFISLNLIILSFFIFIFSISIFDKRRIKEAYVSILSAFRIIQGGGNISPVLGREIKVIPWEPVLDTDPYFGKLANIVDKKGIGIYSYGDFYIVSLKAEAFFSKGSFKLSDKGKKELKLIAKVLKKMKTPIEVQGHTNNIPYRRGRLTNWELSALRALSVMDFLVKEGVKNRIFAYGFGSSRPIYPINTPSGRRKNQRVDIIILKPKAEKNIVKQVNYEGFEFSL